MSKFGTRALHRVVGLVMLLPLVGWAATGAIFFVKPGYAGAYEGLTVKAYPLVGHMALDSNPSWVELRRVRTILGEHLLARNEKGWQHLDPQSLQVKPPPNEDELRKLLNDAFVIDPARYGHVAAVNGNKATTDTGVRVTLDWDRLALSQRGQDTDLIDGLYKIHYLQWTGIPGVDKALGSIGIALVLLLSLLGGRLFFASR